MHGGVGILDSTSQRHFWTGEGLRRAPRKCAVHSPLGLTRRQSAPRLHPRSCSAAWLVAVVQQQRPGRPAATSPLAGNNAGLRVFVGAGVDPGGVTKSMV